MANAAPRGKPFEKGNPGRRIGSRNKRPMEIREMARRIMENPEYLRTLAIRIAEGTAPHMETLMAHYSWGKPKEHIEVAGVSITALQVLLLESRNGANGNGHAIEIEAEAIAIEQIESKNGGNGNGHDE